MRVFLLPLLPCIAAAVVSVHVEPGSLSVCTRAAQNAMLGKTTRCVLAPGTYRESLEYSGPNPLEIVGAGKGATKMDGTEPLLNLDWTPHSSSHVKNGSIYKAQLPKVFQISDIQQAFVDDVWISEARFPNTDITKVLKLQHTWAFCTKGSVKGTCVDRPDKWSDLAKTKVDWTGALATLSVGGRYATYTRKVTKHNGKTFHYNANLGPGPGDGGSNVGSRYFLSGKLEALDSPGEWFINESTWTMYAWMPDSQPPGDRLSIKVRDLCVDSANSTVTVSDISMHACTFRLRGCTSCTVSDLDITYPSYHREIHLRDATPFHGGPPPNVTLLEGNFNTATRLSIRYSNSGGIKVVGSHNVLSELLVEDTDWLGTLDYPPVEVGFGPAEDIFPQDGELGMYPRNAKGTNNTITRATVRRFGNAGIVTSQLSNEVSYSHVYDGSLIGGDAACVHADNSATQCKNYKKPLEDRHDCVKDWHHNWVHDCWGKCVRGDDFTLNLSLHHNVIWNCGTPNSDGMGQSFGVVLKGDYNKFYHNTVLKTSQADVALATGAEAAFGLHQSNMHSVILNAVASRWSGKGGPLPTSKQAHFACWDGMHTGSVSSSMLEDFDNYDFRPVENGSLRHKGVFHAPEVPDDGTGVLPDQGAYQRDDELWQPGCTFTPECENYRTINTIV